MSYRGDWQDGARAEWIRARCNYRLALFSTNSHHHLHDASLAAAIAIESIVMKMMMVMLKGRMSIARKGERAKHAFKKVKAKRKKNKTGEKS